MNNNKLFYAFGLLAVYCCLSVRHNHAIAPSFRAAIYSKQASKSLESNL